MITFPTTIFKPPFNLPPPLRLITEDSELGKCLGLWRLEEL
jgi:hypothetical protein